MSDDQIKYTDCLVCHGRTAAMIPTAEAGASTHRYPCPVRPLRLGPFDQCGHRHSCVHDAEHDSGRLIEHRCECGMTWTVRPGVVLKREQLENRIDELEHQRQAVLDRLDELDSIGWVMAKASAPYVNVTSCASDQIRELLGAEPKADLEEER